MIITEDSFFFMSRIAKYPQLGISREQLVSLQHSFLAMDKDGNGVLDLDELKLFMISQKIDSKYAPLAMKLFDTDGNGTISWKEFLLFSDAMLTIEQDPTKFLRRVFDAIDSQGRGFITKVELHEIIELLGISMAQQEFERKFAETDADKNGQLSFEEAKNFLQF